MKNILMILLLCTGAWWLMSCQEQPDTESSVPEVTTAVTSEAEPAVTTEAVTTAKPAETDAPAETEAYQIADNMDMFVERQSVRASRCTAKLTNHNDGQKPYTFAYRVIEEETGQECRILSNYDPEEDEKDAAEIHWINPGEKRALQYDWGKRYGDLADGTYILEVTLDHTTVYPEDGGAAAVVPVVVRAKFTVEASDFVPRISIAPEDVKPTGVVLTIQNAKDAGRSYAFAYRLYDEGVKPRKELLKVFDKETRLSKNNYVKAGETLQLELDWTDLYGYLLEGQYSIEIEMLADGEKEGKTYHADFEIK